MATPTHQQSFEQAVRHHQAGRLREAEALYRQALAMQSEFPQAWNNLGIILKDTGRLDDAIAAYRHAVAQRANYVAAYINLGNVLRIKNLPDPAIAAYRHALDIQPGSAEALHNLGLILKDAQRYDEAIAAFGQALAVRPHFPETYNGLGLALKGQGRIDEGIAALRQAIALRPEYVEAHSNLAFAMLFDSHYDAPAIGQELQRWNRQHAEPLRKFIRPHANNRDPHRRLRIGYVSPDFRAHVVARNILPLLAHHDQSQFEIFAYANVQLPDARTEQLRGLCDHWRNIFGTTDEQAAEQIRADRIDILVDLALHTANNRLLIFARKPAPIAVSFAGYPGSTGLTAIDYRLSDPHLDPPGEDESWSSERILRLGDSFWCYDPLEERDIPVFPLPASSAGHITFGCLSQFAKINSPVLHVWAAVMRAVPDSRLLLLAPQGAHRQRALDQLGIASSRIEFIPNQPRRDYLELYRRIDIGLDTFPYNGHTTSLDSFWMGVPVITLAGRTTVARAGVSQAMNLNLPELIATTPAQFVQLATALASDLPRLSKLRAELRARMESSPLMNAGRFAASIESAYQQMWGTWRGGSRAQIGMSKRVKGEE